MKMPFNIMNALKTLKQTATTVGEEEIVGIDSDIRLNDSLKLDNSTQCESNLVTVKQEPLDESETSDMCQNSQTTTEVSQDNPEPVDKSDKTPNKNCQNKPSNTLRVISDARISQSELFESESSTDEEESRTKMYKVPKEYQVIALKNLKLIAEAKISENKDCENHKILTEKTNNDPRENSFLNKESESCNDIDCRDSIVPSIKKELVDMDDFIPFKKIKTEPSTSLEDVKNTIKKGKNINY